jgi:hypothetical protein
MQASYRLKPEELTAEFIQKLKAMYFDKNVDIEINVGQAEDETEYLMKSRVNREHLLNAIEEVRQGNTGQTMTMEELERFEV